jgi:hypothetical protein
MKVFNFFNVKLLNSDNFYSIINIYERLILKKFDWKICICWKDIDIINLKKNIFLIYYWYLNWTTIFCKYYVLLQWLFLKKIIILK